ncbi:MAG: hypothetical protein OEY89_15610 [Gammaproteobacteria bacterium]|nr:hypothetical protein [Gammaproteobacteria bacterium]
MQGFYKASKNTTYSITIFIICYIFLLIFALSPPSAFDSYWHLQMGRDLLENGLSPWIDHYSFTNYGKEISSVPIAFQVLLASFVSIFGEDRGFYFFKTIYISALMLFLYLYFKQIRASWQIVFLVLPFLMYFISLRLMIRPELISNVLMVICLSLYIKARESFATKELLSICLLLLFWVNYHSPIFGYIIIFGLFLDRAIHKLYYRNSNFSWLQWFSWGSAIFLIGFIKPSGQHVLIASLSMLNNEYAKYIQEYLPSNTIFSMDKIVYLSWILSAYAMIMSLVKKQYGFAFIAILLGYFSWSTARLVAPVGIINFCILGYLLSQQSYSNIYSKLKPSIRNSLLFLYVSLCGLAFFTLAKSTLFVIDNLDKRSEILDRRYPIQSTDYLKNYQAGGNILNFLSSGGYLINKLSPDFKVFIDGRTNILHPIELLKVSGLVQIPEYDENGMVDSNKLNNILKNYNVQYALYKNTPEMLLMFHNTDKFKLNFADENFLLFSSNQEIAFPISSQLLVLPMCWDESFSSFIEKEISLSDELFSDKRYTLKLALLFLKDYLSNNDKSEFLDSLNPIDLELDSIRRLAGYMALNNHNYTTSIRFFASIQTKDDYDFLMITYALIKNKNFPVAEKLLFQFYLKNKYPEQIILSYEKIAIFNKQLKTIQENYTLEKFLPTYSNELDNNLKKANYNNGIPLESFIPYQYACKQFL